MFRLPHGFVKSLKNPGTAAVIPAALMLLFALLLNVCAYAQTSIGDEQDSDSGIRPNGIVEFLRPDGSLITSVAVEIAESHEAHLRGLQGRPRVAQGFGMLFLYETPRTLGFWMRNTPFSLDIIYVGADMRVLNVGQRVPPMSDMRHWSSGAASFVIEVPAGFAESTGIGTSSIMRWQRFTGLAGEK